jgi:WD40 repeat protein
MVAAGMYRGLIAFWNLDKEPNHENVIYDDPKLDSGQIVAHFILGAIAYSPDGKTLATCGGGGNGKAEIKLWDMSTFKNVFLVEDKGFVYSIAYSSDGNLLVSGGNDGLVKLWDIKTRKEIASLKSSAQEVYCVVFSQDGKMVASGANDGSITIWDVKTHKHISTLHGHIGSIVQIVFSHEGKTLYSGGSDWTVRFWDVENQKTIQTLNESGWRHSRGHAEPLDIPENEFTSDVKSLALSPDGKTLAVGDASRIYLFETSSAKQIGCYVRKGNSAIHVLAFSPDGKTLVSSGSNDGKPISLWNIDQSHKSAIPNRPLK